MRLQTKFIVLVVGITILPVLSMILVSAFQFGFAQIGVEVGSYPLGQQFSRHQWIRNHLIPALEADRFVDVQDEIPQDLYALVVDESNAIIHSTSSDYQVGDSYTYNEFDAAQYEFSVLPYEQLGSGVSGKLIVRNPKLDWNHGPTMGYVGLLIYLGLLILVSVMSVQIIRSIRKSISTLESAASSIAEGDLDFELEANGRDEIASLTLSFDIMRRKLKDEYAKRARFIMGVSHDLKTPLTLIEGYVDAIQEGYADEPDKLHRYLAIIKSKSKILETRIAQLIEFVKMDTIEWKSRHVQVNLNTFLADLAKRYADDAGLLGFDFEYTVDLPSGYQVDMDAELVTRALENLIHNAIRYAGSAKYVQFEAYYDAKHVYISIGNSGRGILAKDLDHIFEPFYRGSNSRQEDGLGLGLPTVKSIFESHGWDVRVTSTPGEATVFTVYLPASS